MSIREETQYLVFYDGTCGLCQSFVRFSLSRLRKEKSLIFLPIGGSSFEALFKNQIQSFPDSILIYDVKLKKTYTQVKAIQRILPYLNLTRKWRVLAFLLNALPTAVGDLGYAAVAKVRHRYFKSLCTCAIRKKNGKNI